MIDSSWSNLSLYSTKVVLFSKSIFLIPKTFSNFIFNPLNESFFRISSAFPPFSELIFGKIGFENNGLKLHLKGKL